MLASIISRLRELEVEEAEIRSQILNDTNHVYGMVGEVEIVESMIGSAAKLL